MKKELEKVMSEIVENNAWLEGRSLKNALTIVGKEYTTLYTVKVDSVFDTDLTLCVTLKSGREIYVPMDLKRGVVSIYKWKRGSEDDYINYDVKYDVVDDIISLEECREFCTRVEKEISEFYNALENWYKFEGQDDPCSKLPKDKDIEDYINICKRLRRFNYNDWESSDDFHKDVAEANDELRVRYFEEC